MQFSSDLRILPLQRGAIKNFIHVWSCCWPECIRGYKGNCDVTRNRIVPHKGLDAAISLRIFLSIFPTDSCVLYPTIRTVSLFLAIVVFCDAVGHDN